MTRGFHIYGFLFLLCCTTEVMAQQVLQDHIQPYSGTAPSTTPSALKHSEAGSEKNANTIPAVTLPFAMTQWTPQTRATEVKCLPPYYYKDSLFSGIRATHWISGSCMQDYGSFTLMPMVGQLKSSLSDYAISFRHDQEKTGAAYYSLRVPAFTIEVTPALRSGIIRITAHTTDTLYLLVQPNSDEGVGTVAYAVDQQEVKASNPVHRIYQGWGTPAGFSGHLAIRFSKRFLYGIPVKDSHAAALVFYMKQGEQLEIYAGTSFTGTAGAALNRDTEIGKQHFDALHQKARTVWEAALSRIQVRTNNQAELAVFYTALYHAFQHPRLYNDVDGRYPLFSRNGETGILKTGNYYDDFSMWDIYRAQLPLIEILQPEQVNSFIRSLVDKGRQGGWLPVFPCWNSYTAAMIGDHVTAFIAAAFTKGFRDYDTELAYQLLRKNAFEVPERRLYKDGLGRRALDSYLRFGFIPAEDSVPDAFHKKEQVSRTLEYAYDDYALSSMAKRLGKQADAEALRRRAFNYRNVFDTTVGMVRGRHAAGNWVSHFAPDQREYYITEGTPRQYSFYVPQDMRGLAELMGGAARLEAALDSLFARNEYWHGNEPGHQIPFLYNFTAAPYKSQRIIQQLRQEEYSAGPGGLSGNDDAGQMSAWYVFAALGFYPVDPVSGNYQLATPLFDEIRIGVPGNKTFRISVKKESGNSIYIKEVKWNGWSYPNNYITYAMLKTGGLLEYRLSDRPTTWGSKEAQRAAGLTK